jgi:BirA family biotin operon repressor/biotin-[acetyl-CoA-carboxylase] ligase
MARGLHPSYNAIMLTVEELRAELPVNGLGEPLYFFSTIGSTSVYARELGEQGAPHGTLVVADEQTAGRGRGENAWSTPAQSAIAFSVVLRPENPSPDQLGGMNAIGALAVVRAVDALGGRAEIKWPNDVLIDGSKVAGILTDVSWSGHSLDYAVVGIGVNVRPASVPDGASIAFPAACLEDALGRSVDRLKLLVAILGNLAAELGNLGTSTLIEAWNDSLAFRGRRVRVDIPDGMVEGVLSGLTPGGLLVLDRAERGVMEIGGESASMRPIDT